MRTPAEQPCPECGQPARATSHEAHGTIHTAVLCPHCGHGDRTFRSASVCLLCGAPAWADGWCVDHAPSLPPAEPGLYG